MVIFRYSMGDEASQVCPFAPLARKFWLVFLGSWEGVGREEKQAAFIGGLYNHRTSLSGGVPVQSSSLIFFHNVVELVHSNPVHFAVLPSPFLFRLGSPSFSVLGVRLVIMPI